MNFLTLPKKRIELRILFNLGWPIFLAQSSQTAMGLADTLMSSWAGVDELAAISVGAGLWLPLFLSLSGVMLGLTPLVANLVGAEQRSDTPTQLHHSLVLALMLGVIAVILLNNSGPLLDWLEVEQRLKERTLEYLFAISWGLPALLIYQAIRSYAEGFGQTRATMKIGVLAVLINIPLNYMLIFGKFGLPELGGVGCGWASSISFWLMLICGTYYLHRGRHFADLMIWQGRITPKLSTFRQHLSIGLPIALSLLIETSMFCIIALLLAKYGAEVLAANQITIRIGHLNGAKRPTQARRVAILGMLFSLILAGFNFSAMLYLASPLAAFFSDNEGVINLAIQLLSFAALYQFSDSIQLACTGALRGYKDTQIPLLIAFVAYWLIGLPSGYFLAEIQLLGPVGYWLGILIGLSLGAVFLLIRFNKISKHAQLEN